MKHDATALKTADGAYQLSHPYLRVPPHKSVLSLKAYILHKFQFAPEQVAVEILGQFKNKVSIRTTWQCIVFMHKSFSIYERRMCCPCV